MKCPIAFTRSPVDRAELRTANLVRRRQGCTLNVVWSHRGLTVLCKAKKTLPDPQVLKTPTMASSQESHIMPQIDQESHTVPQMDQCHNMPRVSPPMQMMFNYDHRWQNTTSFQSPFPAASQAKSAWMNQKVTRSHDGSLSLSDHRRLNETLSTTTGHFGAV
mmetsp:Transcript_28122/g.74241  ORF Transcript_28122/g.74241 Transcript_28122/m.74241 type:complete len:162 (+) Transcript_28122:537-1022(+)